MWSLGPLGFAAPWVLLGLLALPLIWLVARAIPPRPSPVIFPPIDIVRTLKPTEETPRSAPWWLMVLRAVALGLIILGLSGPILNPQDEVSDGDILIVVDDGWTAAPGWRTQIEEAVSAARAANGQVRLLLTAPDLPRPGGDDVLTGASAAARLAALSPKPWLADHAKAAQKAATLPKFDRVLWFSDGIAQAGSAELARTLVRLGPVRQRLSQAPLVAMTRAGSVPQGFTLGLLSGPASGRSHLVEAVNARGRTVADDRLTPDLAGSVLPVPSTLTRDVAMLRVADAPSAGGVRLLDAFDRRVRVGLAAERVDDQPLLSDAHYLSRAIGPFSEVTRGTIEVLTAAGLDVILLPDVGELPAREVESLERFLVRGGMLVRFAGPKLVASGAKALLPVELAAQPRALGGALSWDGSGKVQPFSGTGPFAGLSIPDDVRVKTIAVPAPDAIPSDVWARLSDGTPLVSAKQQGKGQIVLIHTTAGPAWSDVAFSGVQVSMLRRIMARAATSAIPATIARATAPLKPVLVLDGFGRVRPPDSDVRPILAEDAGSVQPGPGHPPGIYEAAGTRLVLQPAGPQTRLAPLPNFAGVSRLANAQAGPRMLGAPLLILGIALLAFDALIALLIAGGLSARLKASLPSNIRWPWLKTTGVAMIAAIACSALMLGPTHGWAQSASVAARTKAQPGALSLVYLKTGDAPTDARARTGLEGLSRALADRTSVEPGGVIGVDASIDDLALHPLIYWLLPDTPRALSPEAARALDRFMKSGGVLFIDTRGAGRDPAVARTLTRTALRGIETPPLEPVPAEHVMTKSFYILRGFPGRFTNARIWVETSASAAASANDGVSALIVGDGDWASAWAQGANGTPLGAVSGGAINREVAMRVGINVVIYALTGNYKADQVHVPALLERLGRPRAPRQ